MVTHAALEIILDDIAITAVLQESGIAAHHIPYALDAARKIQPDVTEIIGRFIMSEIASQEGVDRSYVSRVMTLAFLAPDITESIIAGRQPTDLTVEKLTKRIDLPLEWAQQRQLLGSV